MPKLGDDVESDVSCLDRIEMVKPAMSVRNPGLVLLLLTAVLQLMQDSECNLLEKVTQASIKCNMSSSMPLHRVHAEFSSAIVDNGKI